MFVVGSAVILAIFYWFIRKPRLSREITSLEKDKVTNLQKFPEGQKLKQIITSPKPVSNKKIKEIITKEKQSSRSPAQSKKKKRGYSIHNFFDKRREEYSWSNNVFAVLKSAYNGDPDKILGEIGNMILIFASSKPPKSFYVAMSNSSGKIGYYTGEIIVVTKNREVEVYFKQKSMPWALIAGSYIVALPNIEEALSIVKELRVNFPSAVIDIDFNTSYLEAK